MGTNDLIIQSAATTRHIGSGFSALEYTLMFAIGIMVANLILIIYRTY